MCKCAEQVSKKLEKEVGYGLDLAFVLSKPVRTYPRIAVNSRRKRSQVIVPTYCPFCGKKYPK
jgi:hypothetical protein